MFTDEQTTKALEICMEQGYTCGNCPFYPDCSRELMARQAYKVIHHLTAENRRLQQALIEKSVHKIEHDSLCETLTYKSGGSR